MQACKFHFVAQQLVGEAVELARVPVPNTKFAGRGVLPLLEWFNALGNLREIRRALDGISHRGEENIGIGLLDVLDSGFDVGKIFALVAPHQEHPGLNACCTAECDSVLHLLHGHAALHGVENALRAAF